MKLSTRSKYGLRAMLELALAYGQKPMQIRMIAEKQDISSKYLEQLIAMMRSSGLVRSIRGPKGGYILSKPPSDIKLSEIFTVLEGPMVVVDCLVYPEYCPRCADCVTRSIWSDIQDAMMGILDSTTLQDLVDKAASGADSDDYRI